ncbi:MAG: hypothetical protein JSS72_12215 [Armatimonadetes bacterium]|nr:hypothetical protein [Armatimonadota bacterium]
MKESSNIPNIDEALNSPSQKAVQEVVSNLPDEQVSMAWRSDLNQKLMAEVGSVRRKRFVLYRLSPALLGVGLAAALFVMRMPPSEGGKLYIGKSSGLEARMLDDYQNSAKSSVLDVDSDESYAE